MDDEKQAHRRQYEWKWNLCAYHTHKNAVLKTWSSWIQWHSGGKICIGPGKIKTRKQRGLNMHTRIHFFVVLFFLSYNPRMMGRVVSLWAHSLLVYRNNYRKRTLCNYSGALCMNRIELIHAGRKIVNLCNVWIEQQCSMFEMCVRARTKWSKPNFILSTKSFKAFMNHEWKWII